MKKAKGKKLDLKSKVRRIPEFKGVVFWDITPLLKTSVASENASGCWLTITGIKP